MLRRVLGTVILLIAGCGVAAAQADLDSTMSLLKGAESQKDLDQIKKLAVEAITQGRAEVTAAAADKERADFARSVQEYGEFALLNAALPAPAATKVDLLATLEQASPKSKYLAAAYPVYFQALKETNAAAKIPAVAEKALVNFPENEDLLSNVMEDAAGKGQSDRALTYSNRLVAAINKHTKPEEMSAADWEKKRATLLGAGYFYAGRVYYAKKQFIQADKSLRSALPFVKGNDAMQGMALFILGGANYEIGVATNSKAKVQEAANFCTQASKITFPQAQEAWRQAQLMTTAAAKMR
jgi:tetratricopeptide (TPR) repeat protein